jgi:glycosyltransferase involved in cell wall biosynthesis
VDHRFEVVVTDDGSRDATAQVVAEFGSRVPFPVHFTTHPHEHYHLSRCRNEGVVVSQAPYLLFLDGDCLIPPDHVWHHLRQRRPGQIMAGYCCSLDQSSTEQLSCESIVQGEFMQRATMAQRRRLFWMDVKARYYNLIGHATKPKLFGGNVGLHRVDYQRINGYDENFVGWGCEDDDLRLRARQVGLRVRSILRWTCTYHLWHPPGETTPSRWRDGHNVAYLLRSERPAFCENGLSKYLMGNVPVRVRSWNVLHDHQLRRSA